MTIDFSNRAVFDDLGDLQHFATYQLAGDGCSVIALHPQRNRLIQHRVEHIVERRVLGCVGANGFGSPLVLCEKLLNVPVELGYRLDNQLYLDSHAIFHRRGFGAIR